jgi:hypothetical protein
MFASTREINDAQGDLLLAVLRFLRGYRGDTLVRLTDDDVENAASALAATHETAARGIVYEQRPQSLAAQRLVGDLGPVLAPLGRDRGTSFDRDLGVVFRAIARGVQEARKSLDGGDTAYLAMIGRFVGLRPETGPEPETPGSRLVV